MFEILGMGILLGWGAAIPIGPINLEVIRRNLQFGTRFGVSFGYGACAADMFFLALLSYGALLFLSYPLVIKTIGVVGAVILVYFAYCAFTQKGFEKDKIVSEKDAYLYKSFLSGLVLTLFNPFTILFWGSISAQVVSLSQSHPNAIIWVAIGVLLGTVSWITSLNLFVHFTKHKISDRVIQIMNKTGGVILLGFAGFSIYYTLFLNPT